MLVTDKIEKQVLLRAPLARVWRAISDSAEFGRWFGLQVQGPFVPHTTVRAAIVPTTVDPNVAEMQKPYEGFSFDLMIEDIEPEERFSMRWHPYAVEQGVDYSSEPTTLVEFELEETDDGVLLTITESGFDQIPIGRRAEAFNSNDGGWAKQCELIKGYVETK